MRRKKLTRIENRELIIRLIDLGFTVGAVAYMLSMTDMNVYAHLKKEGRMEGRKVLRYPLWSERGGTMVMLSDESVAAVRKLYANPECLLLALAAMTVSVETKPISTGSAKKPASSAVRRRSTRTT